MCPGVSRHSNSTVFPILTISPADSPTDILGILLVIPITRRLILGIFINKKKYEKKSEKKNYIDGEFEELGKDDDKKI